MAGFPARHCSPGLAQSTTPTRPRARTTWPQHTNPGRLLSSSDAEEDAFPVHRPENEAPDEQVTRGIWYLYGSPAHRMSSPGTARERRLHWRPLRRGCHSPSNCFAWLRPGVGQPYALAVTRARPIRCRHRNSIRVVANSSVTVRKYVSPCRALSWLMAYSLRQSKTGFAGYLGPLRQCERPMWPQHSTTAIALA